MRNKSYSISLKVVVDTDIEIKAKSYEEALEKARQIKVRDVVEFDTCFNDGSVSITGVYNFDESAHA
jgi:hypothetical protein